MKTSHKLIHGDARRLPLEDSSINLVVTSPPYPMVAMWDECFSSWDRSVAQAFDSKFYKAAYDKIHVELNTVWRECYRVLKPGGICCINIGDAVRTTQDGFRIFNNHACILENAVVSGFVPLPDIIWHKQTNAPNKFMGSGMLPGGAYVTYEHEYILVLKKGAANRTYSAAEKTTRAQSAFFWEERNVWFSDIWDVKGTRQTKGKTTGAAERTGAFPTELPFRLTCMFSCYGDIILDPFAGTGTTALAAMAAGRNSISIELDMSLAGKIGSRLVVERAVAVERTERRLRDHAAFVGLRDSGGREALKHRSKIYGFPVVTAQERELELYIPNEVRILPDGSVEAEHRLARIAQHSPTK